MVAKNFSHILKTQKQINHLNKTDRKHESVGELNMRLEGEKYKSLLDKKRRYSFVEGLTANGSFIMQHYHK
jgi:hypothetical protein